jgi:hypothetical protein
MSMNFWAEQLNITAGADHVTVTYERLEVSTTSRHPHADGAIPMGPITTHSSDVVAS